MKGEAFPIPLARRVGRVRWLNGRVFLGALLFAAAFFTGQRVLANAQALTPVWQAVRDLPAGELVQPSDLEVADVRLPESLLELYVPAAQPPPEAVLLESLAAGELLPRKSLGPTGPPQSRLTIPIAPEMAVDPELGLGSKVDVLATFSPGERDSKTVPIGAALEVVGLGRDPMLSGSQSQLSAVTLAVPAEDASRIAFAVHNAQLDLIKVSGAETGDVVEANGDDF